MSALARDHDGRLQPEGPIDHLIFQAILGLGVKLDRIGEDPEEWERTYTFYRAAGGGAGVAQQQYALPGAMDDLRLAVWESSGANVIVLPGKQDSPSLPGANGLLNAICAAVPGGSAEVRVNATDVQYVTVWWPVADASNSPSFVTLRLRGRRRTHE